MNLYDEYKTKLAKAIKIKSISTDPHFSDQITEMSEWCVNEFKKAGFEVRVFTNYKNPIIYATYTVDKNLPTVLQYGHYDVQPATLEQGWNYEPFELSEDNAHLFARGVVDNKGQFIIYLTALENLIKEGKLKYNVKFILEGEEEIGSPSMEKFVNDNLDLLKSDFALISDGTISNSNPAISVSFRGTFNAEITVFGPKIDLHSGSYGGVVNNPINVLGELISKITTNNGETNFLIDKVEDPDSLDIQNLSDNPYKPKEFKTNTGVDPIATGGLDFYKKIGFANTIQVTGIQGGYTGEGFRNAVPSKATAKVNVRLNPNLNANEAAKEFKNYIAQNMPKDIEYIVEIDHASQGVKMDLKNEYTKKASKILQEVYGEKVIYEYVGGTIPIAYDLSKRLGMPALFVGFANDDCNMHGPNENFDIDLAKKALTFAYRILGE